MHEFNLKGKTNRASPKTIASAESSLFHPAREGRSEVRSTITSHLLPPHAYYRRLRYATVISPLLICTPRLSPSDPMRLHVVDGGYYENTGIGALVAWLNEALTELQGQDRPKQILVITIGAFPPNTNPKYAGRRGAIFQFEAPFLT